MTSMQKWLRIGATLMFGLFVAYLDRSNLSVTLPTITHDLVGRQLFLHGSEMLQTHRQVNNDAAYGRFGDFALR